MNKIIKIGNIEIGNDLPIVLIAGSCVIESREHALFMATSLADITKILGIPFIYKTSFTKANRTSVNSFTGIDFDECLDIFDEIRALGIPVITDVHTPEQCQDVAKHVDILQIPALLSRQTDLVFSAASTGLPVNIKQGQFAAPWDMVNALGKVERAGGKNAMLCHRGITHGYNQLLADMTTFKFWKDNYDVKFVVIDYIGLIPSTGKFDSREREIAHLSRFFKLLAKEMDIIILMISQQNREGGLAESMGLYRDCDFAFSIRKPYYEGAETIKIDKVSYPISETDFVIKYERNRHGVQSKQFTASYVGNIFRETDLTK